MPPSLQRGGGVLHKTNIISDGIGIENNFVHFYILILMHWKWIKIILSVGKLQWNWIEMILRHKRLEIKSQFISLPHVFQFNAIETEVKSKWSLAIFCNLKIWCIEQWFVQIGVGAFRRSLEGGSWSLGEIWRSCGRKKKIGKYEESVIFDNAKNTKIWSLKH